MTEIRCSEFVKKAIDREDKELENRMVRALNIAGRASRKHAFVGVSRGSMSISELAVAVFNKIKTISQ